MNFCPNCGAKLDGRFCSNCGYDTLEQQAPKEKKEKKKISDFFKNIGAFIKRHKIAAIVTSAATVVAVVAIVVVVSLSNIFRIGKVEKIELGMSKVEVTEMLGDPTDKSDSGNKWYYYEKKFAKKYEEVVGAVDDFLDMDEDISEDEFEDSFEDLDDAYTELEEMTFKAIIVSFSDGKVTEVFFDKNHKYDEFDDYATAEEKTAKKTEIAVDTVEVDISTITREQDDGTEQVEEDTNILTELRGVQYTVRFTDGSYILGKTSPTTELNNEKTQVTLQWRDSVSSYSDHVKLVVSRETSLKIDKTGTLTSWTSTPKNANVVLPSGIIAIGENVFKGEDIVGITIPDSVTSIGEGAFEGCSNLTSITVGKGLVEDMGELYLASVQEINISEENPTYSSIDGNVYSKDGSTLIRYMRGKTATSFTIPDSVISIGSYAFYNCSNLTSITIPDSVTSIGGAAFEYCSSLTSITIPDGVTSIGEWAFSNCSSLTSITIGDSVTSIGAGAFKYCSSLTSITIPDSVTSIGAGAFEYCYKLVEVYNKSSLTITKGSRANGAVGYYALNVYTPSDGASKLATTNDGYTFYANGDTVYLVGYTGTKTELILPDNYNGSCYAIYKYAFYNCISLTSITIPDSVTSIGAGAFKYCSSLTSITIPDSVTSIGAGAFKYCSSLTSITIPDSVTSIGEGAFESCSSLTSIVIPNGVTSIGAGAFESCSNLTSITIGDGVTSIGEYAFAYCSSLTSITVGKGLGENIDKLYLVSVQEINISEENPTYSSIDGNVYSKDGSTLIRYMRGKTATSFTISDSVTSIGAGAFYDCSSLTSITIPDSVTSIGAGAFESCSNLTSITIPDGVTSIGERAFYNCSGLTSVTIGDGVTSIGAGAFYDCSSLTSITVGKGLGENIDKLYLASVREINISTTNPTYSSIDGNVYSKDGTTLIRYMQGKTATSFTIPDSVISIGAGAFYDCSNLTSITIPDGVTSIGGSAFEYCSSLTSITIPDGVTSIGGSAFYKCSGLTSVTIGDGVTSIGKYAFYKCSSLTSVTIGDSVTSIGGSAFYDCDSLTNVYYKGTAEEWSEINMDFYNTKLTSATRYYYIENEADVPTDGGNYWHYVDGVPTAWVLE